jgi:putative transposase
MAKRRHTAEQIISKLREAEVFLAKGTKMPQVCRKIGITEQAYYRWRRECGGVRTDQIKRLKEVEKENVRLKRVVADLTLDNAILKEAASERNAISGPGTQAGNRSRHGFVAFIIATMPESRATSPFTDRKFDSAGGAARVRPCTHAANTTGLGL